MGGLCSVPNTGNGRPDKAPSEIKSSVRRHHISKMAPSWIHEKITHQKMKAMNGHSKFQTVDAYEEERSSLLTQEKSESFDGQAMLTASAQERRANDIVMEVRQRDAELFYNSGRDIAGQVMIPEIHFVGNASNIESTELFKIARRMPKGAHLHCHFNSCLPPRFLLQQAKCNAHMYIKSNLALTSADNRERAEIQFQMHVLEEERHLEQSVSPLHDSYEATFDEKDKTRGWYSYDRFLQEYPGGTQAAENWLNSKLLFTEEEVYGVSQTAKK
jgi:adenosine deaminase CECR1